MEISFESAGQALAFTESLDGFVGTSSPYGLNNFPTPALVSAQEGYFNATLNFTQASHFEVGIQFAEAITGAIEDYEQIADRALLLQMDILGEAGVTFETVLTRANAIINNPAFHSTYRDEITGMQQVFNSDIDILGDGILSSNELLVFQFVPDVMRAFSCSATAAYGSKTKNGTTIAGRNLEWIIELIPDISKIYSVTTFINPQSSHVNIGLLGQLFSVSAFNDSKIFGSLLDSATTDLEVSPPEIVLYPKNLDNIRSYSFDLRYALENFETLNAVSNYLTSPDHKYAFNHLIFLADAQTAGVVENNVNLKPLTSGNRSLRTSQSSLNPAIPQSQQWGIRDAIATVNDFRLPGNDYAGALSDTARWTSFKNLYAKYSPELPSSPSKRVAYLINAARANYFSGGKKGFPHHIDLDDMKKIMGYHPPGTGLMEKGAIFVNETTPEVDAWPGLTKGPLMFSTIQSIVLDMNSLDLHVSFTPGDNLLKEPIYQKIPTPIMTKAIHA